MPISLGEALWKHETWNSFILKQNKFVARTANFILKVILTVPQICTVRNVGKRWIKMKGSHAA